jgi:hypothetical protein
VSNQDYGKPLALVELYSAIMRLFDQAIRDDEELQPQLDERLPAIYDALSTPGPQDFLGAVDASVDTHLGLVMEMAARGTLLAALLEEYETRFRAAVDAPGRTFAQPLINQSPSS